mmetsp:Transcript_15475/g.45656  ORF Transcript_15475/g.45656 Transcript_15475/m.45656 type:complete len:280 (-) Transcript_15475:1449-2288(-)
MLHVVQQLQQVPPQRRADICGVPVGQAADQPDREAAHNARLLVKRHKQAAQAVGLSHVVVECGRAVQSTKHGCTHTLAGVGDGGDEQALGDLLDDLGLPHVVRGAERKVRRARRARQVGVALEDLAAGEHRRLADLFVVVANVTHDVVAHEFEQVHLAPVKRGQALQAQPHQRAALQLPARERRAQRLELGLRRRRIEWALCDREAQQVEQLHANVAQKFAVARQRVRHVLQSAHQRLRQPRQHHAFQQLRHARLPALLERLGERADTHERFEAAHADL